MDLVADLLDDRQEHLIQAEWIGSRCILGKVLPERLAQLLLDGEGLREGSGVDVGKHALGHSSHEAVPSELVHQEFMRGLGQQPGPCCHYLGSGIVPGGPQDLQEGHGVHLEMLDPADGHGHLAHGELEQGSCGDHVELRQLLVNLVPWPRLVLSVGDSGHGPGTR